MPVSKAYPTELLPPPSFNFNIERAASTVRTQIQRGFARQRVVETKPRNIVSTSWLFSPAEINLFRSWFEDELNQGSEWFQIPLKLGAITRVFEMRFTTGFTESHRAVNNWDVNAQLEIYDMQNCSYGEVEAAVIYFLENPETPFTGGILDVRMEAIEIFVSTEIDDSASSIHDHKFIRVDSATDVNITLPENPLFTDPTEFFFVMSRVNTGEVTFVPEGAVTIDSKDSLLQINGTNSVVAVHYLGSNKYHIYGDLK